MPTIDRMTPTKGKTGEVAVIHGTGFKEGQVAAGVTIMFGTILTIPAGNIEVQSGQVIRLTIPEVPVDRRTPTDPSLAPLKVTVTMEGKSVAREFVFQFDPAGPQPVVDGAGGAYDASQNVLLVDVVGRSFTTPGTRKPVQAFLVDYGASGNVTEATDTALKASISMMTDPRGSELWILLGFSDGSAARTPPFVVPG